MFNMECIGRRISELRKARNMTQTELADKMNISFQAVSNWERGNSMPDISKLPELATLFGVSIDELLGGKSKLLESVINESTADYLERNAVTADELKDVIPILKPRQVDTIIEKILPALGLADLEDILPFINHDTVDQLAVKAAESGDFDGLDKIIPFASRGAVNGIAKKMAEEGKSIEEIAPFVDREFIGELAHLYYERGGLSSLEDILPFMPKDALRGIADQEYAKRGLWDFEEIAPFLDRQYLSELARRAIEKDGIKAISPIVPFLDKSMLSEFIKEKFL